MTERLVTVPVASRPGAQDAQRLAGDRAGSGRDAFADRTTNLAHAFGAQLCRIRDARPGAVTLEFVRSDTLADPIPRAAPRRIPDRRDKGRRESTKVSYRDALRPVREHLGNRKLQSITKADIENLVDWMLTSGRKRGGKPGAGLGPRSVRLTLGRLKAAFEMAVDEGRLVRNVVKLVTPPEYKPQERDIWSKAEVRKFLRTAAPTRLHAAWRLSLYGLGRGEVLGLRWSDIDLKAKTLTVQQARVLVDYKVRVEEPKSHNGKRVLPLDDDLVAALTELRKRQARESEDAGTAYGADLADLDWVGRRK